MSDGIFKKKNIQCQGAFHWLVKQTEETQGAQQLILKIFYQNPETDHIDADTSSEQQKERRLPGYRTRHIAGPVDTLLL